MKYAVLLTFFITTGCVGQQEKPQPPVQPVLLPVPEVRILYATKKLEIMEDLLRPCPIRQLQSYTIDDLNKTIKALQNSIAKCNDDKQKIKYKINESN